MRRASFALVLLSSPAAAGTPVPHGPGCALSTAECVMVAREIAIDDAEAASDEQAFGFPTDLPTRLELIHRQARRMRARVAKLPPRIGLEFARLRDCQAGDRLALAQGTTNEDPKCR